jgi:hypothetical protein
MLAMVYVPATEENVSLAHAVNNRIDADGRLIRGQGMMLTAKAWLWRFAGLGAFVMLAGIGIGSAFYGYSYVSDSRTSAEKMAAAFAAALEHANLGTVKLDHQATIGVSGTVEMTPGTVSLEPGGTVRVIGDIPTMVRPTERQLNGGPTTITQQTSSKVVTNFTIFKSTAFGNGFVKTGWNFATSEQPYPSGQFCYYEEPAALGVKTIMYLAEDGKLSDAALAYKSINTRAAAQNCVWFNNAQTQ